MKKLRLVLLILIPLLILMTISSCAAPEPLAVTEPVIEEQVPEPEPEVIEEPVMEEEPDMQESQESTVSGTPELLWNVPHENKLHSIALSPDAERIAVGEYKVTYVYLNANGVLADVIVHEHSVEDLDYLPDGSILGAGQGYFGILLTNTDDSTEQMTLEHGHNSRLAFSPDGNHMATGDRSGIIWIWQIDDNSQKAILEDPSIFEKSMQNQWVIDINYHPSGNILSSTHNDSSVYIWDIENETVLQTLELSDPYFQFSPDGTIMAGALREEGEYLVRLWDVESYEKIADMVIPAEVLGIAFSPDGSMMAVPSFARPTARDAVSATTIYEVPSGKILYTLDQTLEDGDWPVLAAFTPDGGHVAVARNDGTLEMWRLPGAEPLVAPAIDMLKPPPLPSDVMFDTASADLKESAYGILEEFAEELYGAAPQASITFIGHTDSRGDSAYNLQLSLDRASAVKDWFESWADENGIESWEFLVDGRGDTELKVPDTDIEGKFLEEAGALNRRVEIEIDTTD